NALGRAKEELHAFSQKLGDVLTEPAPAPGAPAVPGAPPIRHLPPDAKDAAGVPNTYLAIEAELEKALHDVLDRAQAWEEAQAAQEAATGRQDAADVVREFPPNEVLNDPERLLALKKKLDDHHGNAAFSAEFVKLYGAENMLAIPRTLQAWGNQWNSFHQRA